jgi:macrolide transport system ATP-binding/permease protein
MQLLADLHGAGHTVMVVTHDPRMANFATEIIHLLDGKVENNLNGGSAAAPAKKQRTQ